MMALLRKGFSSEAMCQRDLVKRSINYRVDRSGEDLINFEMRNVGQMLCLGETGVTSRSCEISKGIAKENEMRKGSNPPVA